MEHLNLEDASCLNGSFHNTRDAKNMDLKILCNPHYADPQQGTPIFGKSRNTLASDG